MGEAKRNKEAEEKGKKEQIPPNEEISLTRGEIKEIWINTQRFGNVTGAPKFLYTVNYNRQKLKPVIKALDESITPSQEYKEFQTAYGKLRREFKDDTQPTPQDGEHIIDRERLGEYQIACRKLEKKYEQPIEEWRNQLEEYKELLQGEETVVFRKIPLSKVPHSVNGDQMTLIFPMIHEDLPEDEW